MRLHRPRVRGCHAQYMLYAMRRRPSSRGGSGNAAAGIDGTRTRAPSGARHRYPVGRRPDVNGSSRTVSRASVPIRTAVRCGTHRACATRCAKRCAIRVAFLAAECEPWAKTGGLADVVDALARALGRTGAEARQRPSRRRSTCSCRAIAIVPDLPAEARTDDRSRAGPAGARRAPRRLGHRRRRPTATGSAWSTTRRRSTATACTATRPATTPTTPGGSGCSAGPRSRRSGPTAGRSTSCTSTTGTPGRPRCSATTRYADDPIIGRAAIVLTIHNLAYHGWTPRAALGQLGLRPGDGVAAPNAGRASTCCGPASSGRSSSTRSRRGSPPRR